MRKLWLLSLVLIACKQSGKSIATENEDTLLRQMNLKTSAYWEHEQWDSANNYLNSIKDSARASNYPRFSLYWNLNKTEQLTVQHRFDSASTFLKQASRFLKNNAIKSKDSFAYYLTYSRLFKEQEMIDSALIMGNEAYYITVRNDSSQIAKISYELAILYAMLDDLSNLRKYMLSAWNNRNKEPELTDGIATLLMHYYDRVDRLDSMTYFLNFVQTNSNYNATDLAAMLENTGIVLIRKKQLHDGLEDIMKAKRIRDSLGIESSITYNNLADTYGILGQYNKAFFYIDSAILLANKENDNQDLSLDWETKSELYAKTSQYKKAYEALDSAYFHANVEADSSLRKHARELETKYAVRDKDNQINILSITNESNLKIRNQQRLIILVMIVAIALIGIIVFLLWRRRQVRMQLRETILKQQILRARLDPHFVGNALNTLKHLIRTGITEKALAFVNNLSSLMRFSFENASESYVSLRDEMESLESYLKLQELYRPGLFEYRIEAYKDYEDDAVYIPPMLLQPLVENAIHHGFYNIDYKGILWVRVEKGEHTLHCTIEDNGKGLKQSETDKVKHSTEINRERLFILAKQTRKTASLRIIDKNKVPDETGTKVEIEIPFRLNKGAMEHAVY